ncbi:penicillin-binding protein activator [Myxococcota bacterium]|nr:penicillin-binding protein activator [Myxococcota bacterium]MBU1897407.1 penicillin-binding protein activator [Myxococcota bacterium]
MWGGSLIFNPHFGRAWARLWVWFWVCAALLGCGSSPARVDPPLEPRPGVIARLDPTSDPALEALIAAADPAVAVAALDSATLRRLAPQLPQESPAWGWARLAWARLEAHTGQAALALKALEPLVVAQHPASAEAGALAARLARRQRVTPNLIGVLLPLSGPYAGIGEVAMRAIQMSRQGWPRVRLVFADTQGDARIAADEVRRLVEEEGVGAIIGPVGGLESWAAALMAERLEVPIVTLTAREGICRLGGFVFRHRLTRSAEARALARYAVEKMGIRRFAILYPDVDSAREAMKVFWSTVTRLGGEIRAAHSFPLHAEDFTPAIRKLVGRYHLEIREPSPRWRRLNRKARHRALHYPPLVDFEALYIPASAATMTRLLPRLLYWDVELLSDFDGFEDEQMRMKYQGDPPPRVQVLGSSQLNHPDMARVRPAYNAVFLDSFWEGAPRSEAFVAAWQEKTRGFTPPALAAHAYDAAALLAPAVEGRADRGEIRLALLRQGHRGVFGWSHFEGDGEAALELHVLTLRPEEGVSPRQFELGEGGDEARRP